MKPHEGGPEVFYTEEPAKRVADLTTRLNPDDGSIA
jgi:hypothetical protein